MTRPRKPTSNANNYAEVRTTRCHASMDGDCDWTDCPQEKVYRNSCPLLKQHVVPWRNAAENLKGRK